MFPISRLALSVRRTVQSHTKRALTSKSAPAPEQIEVEPEAGKDIINCKHRNIHQ